MSKLISIKDMRTIAANMDDQGDHRYSHREVRRLLKEQKELTLEEVGEMIEGRIADKWTLESPPWSIAIYPSDLEALKKGEMPG